MIKGPLPYLISKEVAFGYVVLNSLGIAYLVNV